MANVFLTELISILVSVVLLDYVAIIVFLCIAKKAKNIDTKTVRVSVIILFKVLLSAVLVVNSTRIIPIAVACFEYESDNTKEVVGCIEDIRSQNGRKFITIDSQEYVLLNGLGITAETGDYVKVVSGYRSNYIYTLDAL